MKQHDAVPRNQVAVDVFVRKVDSCHDIIQQLKGKEKTVKFSGRLSHCKQQIFFNHFPLPVFSIHRHISGSPMSHGIQLSKSRKKTI